MIRAMFLPRLRGPIHLGPEKGVLILSAACFASSFPQKVEKTFQGSVIDTDQLSANLTSRLLSFLSLKFPIYDIISFDSLLRHSFERIFP